jgi:hypothetical protein
MPGHPPGGCPPAVSNQEATAHPPHPGSFVTGEPASRAGSSGAGMPSTGPAITGRGLPNFGHARMRPRADALRAGAPGVGSGQPVYATMEDGVSRGGGSVIAVEVAGDQGGRPVLVCPGLADSRLSARLFAVGVAGTDAVDPDAPGGPFPGEAPAEVHDSGLGGIVVSLAARGSSSRPGSRRCRACRQPLRRGPGSRRAAGRPGAASQRRR